MIQKKSNRIILLGNKKLVKQLQHSQDVRCAIMHSLKMGHAHHSTIPFSIAQYTITGHIPHKSYIKPKCCNNGENFDCQDWLQVRPQPYCTSCLRVKNKDKIPITGFGSGSCFYCICSQVVKWIFSHQGRDPHWEQAETARHTSAHLYKRVKVNINN